MYPALLLFFPVLIMIPLRGNIVVISMVAMFCAFPSRAEISDEEIQKAKTSGREIAEIEIREAA